MMILVTVVIIRSFSVRPPRQMASTKRSSSDTCITDARRRSIEPSARHPLPQNWPVYADERPLLVDSVREFIEDETSTAGYRTDACRLCSIRKPNQAFVKLAKCTSNEMRDSDECRSE